MDILTDIEQFMAANAISASSFGKLALNDPPFVSQLRNGRRLWPETEAAVRSFMASYSQPKSQERAA